jgi:hypothetical protein
MKTKLSIIRKAKKEINGIKLKAFYQKDGFWVAVGVGYKDQKYVAIFDKNVNLIYCEKVVDYDEYKAYLCGNKSIYIIFLNKKELREIKKNLKGDKEIDQYFWSDELKYKYFYKNKNNYIKIEGHRDIEKILKKF